MVSPIVHKHRHGGAWIDFLEGRAASLIPSRLDEVDVIGFETDSLLRQADTHLPRQSVRYGAMLSC